MRIFPTWQMEVATSEPVAPFFDPAAHESRIIDHHRRVAQVLWEEFARKHNKGGYRRLGDAGRAKRQCWCVETGEYFKSLADAGRSIGMDSAKIFRAIAGGYRVGGKHWTDKPPN